ncbi:MAG TPA: tripartite tricarboxylate transporter TctB family protein [Polyangiaceae bacterium]|nr:tripartite tricarboxylate transporter TctB family protein [Polyangiaceae bacterium]
MGRVSRDLGAGLCLLGISLLAIWQGSDLELGTLRQMGPGMVPRVLAVLLGACGVALSVRALTERPAVVASAVVASPPLVTLPVATTVPEVGARWASLRAPLFLLAAAGAFGLSVRPLGLVVAAPLGILLSMGANAGAARGPRRWLIESLAFALGLTLFCVLLFRTLLSLPMPVAPWLIGY